MITIQSYGKINIFLEITAKNSNLHKLHSLFTKVNIFDTITIKESEKFTIFYENTANTIQNAIQNDIIHKTIQILTKHFPQIHYNFHFKIKKNIPIGSGLGGASSNAAEIIQFLLKKNNISIEKKKIFLIGSEIGSDVPFFLCNSPQILNGTSTELSNPPFTIPKLFCVIIHPKIQLLTSDVFAKIQSPYTHFHAVESFNDALSRTNEMQTTANNITNGIINQTLTAINHPKALTVKMSGSGCACFAIFEEKSNATECFEKIDKTKFTAFNTELLI